jgi:heme oxygenase
LGLSQIVSIYEKFERLWQQELKLLSIRDSVSTSENVQHVLKLLWLPELARADRLRIDLQYITSTFNPALDSHALESLFGCESSVVEDFLEHIRVAVQEKPHVLVAYAWVMYMAIFSGGRWIRQQLRAGGEDFWGHTEDGQDDGFSFLSFTGENDGVPIKVDFKTRLAEVEMLLTATQRYDIIKEAGDIFTHMICMVESLDEIVSAQKHTSEHVPQQTINSIKFLAPSYGRRKLPGCTNTTKGFVGTPMFGKHTGDRRLRIQRRVHWGAAAVVVIFFCVIFRYARLPKDWRSTFDGTLGTP